MERYCPCGKQIQVNKRLCRECADIYGTNPSEWPEWLKWMVSDIQKELNIERNHELADIDEIEPNGRGGYRDKPVFALRGCRTETHLFQERNKY